MKVGSIVRLRGDYYQMAMTVYEIDEDRRRCDVIYLDPKRQPHTLTDCRWEIFHEISGPPR